MTSGFEYNIDITKGTYYLLKSSPEFEALQKVLDSTGLTGKCTLTLCNLKYLHIWTKVIHDTSKDYNSREKMICLTIPNLFEVTEYQLKLIESMEIENLENDCIRKAIVELKSETKPVNCIQYEYITEAGEQVLKIFDKENVPYDIYQLKQIFPMLFISSETEIPGLKLIYKRTFTKLVYLDTSTLIISWPNDATTNFLPTLKKILSELKQK